MRKSLFDSFRGIVRLCLGDSPISRSVAKHRRHRHHELPGEGDLGLALGDLAAASPDAQPEPLELGILGVVLHDVVRGVHEEMAYELVALLGDLLRLVASAGLVPPRRQPEVRPHVARVPEPLDVTGECDERRAVDWPDPGYRFKQGAFLLEVLLAVFGDELVVVVDRLVDGLEKLDLRLEQLNQIVGHRHQDESELPGEGIRVAVGDPHAVGLRHAANGVDRPGAVGHHDFTHLDELDEVLMFLVSQHDGMEVALVLMEKVRNLLGVMHIVLVRVPENRPELMGVPDVRLASALDGKDADPAAVRPRLHADLGTLVPLEERPKRIGVVRQPPAKHDVRLFVESDNGVLFVPQINPDCDTIIHGLFLLFLSNPRGLARVSVVLIVSETELQEFRPLILSQMHFCSDAQMPRSVKTAPAILTDRVRAIPIRGLQNRRSVL